MKDGIFMIVHIYAKASNRLYCSSIFFLYHLRSDPALITQPTFFGFANLILFRVKITLEALF